MPSGLALTLVGFALALLITTAAAVLLGRNPLLPLALAVIGAALVVAQGLWGRRGGRRQRQAVFPSVLLLFIVWSALLSFARLRPAQPQAAVCSSLGLLLSALARQKSMPAVLSGSAPSPVPGASWAAEIIPGPGAGMALLLLGLVAAFWLLWRRDLWAAEVRQLPEERRRGLKAFAPCLRTHPPGRQHRVHQLGDLELADCRRLGSGEPSTWQISVQRQQPPLCRAEAEWTLEVIAAELSGPPSHPPMVMAGPVGLCLIELPEPQGTRSGPEDPQHLAPQTSDDFQPLMPAQPASTNANANGDCSARNVRG